MLAVHRPLTAADRPARWAVPAAVALAMTAANVAKPAYVDDATYYLYARHIAEQPLDPYRFSVMYWDRPVAANHVLAPPLVLYWWSGALRLSDDVAAWKLAMFPFDLLFAGGLYALLRRFAPGWAEPLTVMAGLSPVVLPATNLMLDVPAAGLSLVAVSLFAAACDRPAGGGRAVLAGLVAGLAIQAKYTGLLTPVLLVGYGWAFGRPRLGLLAAAVAAAVAAAWEAFLIVRQGESHFYFHLFAPTAGGSGKAVLAWALVSVVGQTAPFLGLVLAAGLRTPGWLTAAWAAAVLGGVAALLGDWPGQYDIWQGVGLATLTTLAAGGWAVAKSPAADRPPGRFLVLWVAVELAGCFVLSPYSAVRRIIGPVEAATVLVGYLLARGPARRGPVAVAVGGTVLAGVGFAALDHLGAVAHREAAERAVARARQLDPSGKVWYVGYWGFQFYAERAGAEQVVPAALVEVPPPPRLVPWPDEAGVPLARPSEVRAGDWWVAPGGWLPAQQVLAPPGSLEPVGHIVIDATVPFTTTGFYDGAWPLHRLTGPRGESFLSRATRPFVPAVRP